MNYVKSTVDMNPIQEKDSGEKFCNCDTFYLQAIENADGVPFQLIFGPETGDGYYLRIGEGIKDLLGIPAGEFTEKKFQSMIEMVVPLSDDMPQGSSESRRMFLDGSLKKYKAEVLVRLPCGERKWIQDSSLPLIDEETGRVIGAFGILFDINDRKITNISLKTAKDKAEESERLKNAFLHNISHEIRTPLNAIVGFSTLLRDNGNDPQSRKDFLDIVSASSDHLLEILNDIVEISNVEAGTIIVKQETVNINEVLRKIYNGFMNSAQEKKISLCFAEALPDSEVNIRSDIYKLTQILSNLISNAIKFTKKGVVEFGYSTRDGLILFHVSDTGIGIPAEHQPLIFDRFYQAENTITRSYEGTGLGLSISKAYAELLGGSLSFTSEPGSGSVFYLSLPYNSL